MSQEDMYCTYAPIASLVCQRILYPLGTREDVEELEIEKEEKGEIRF